VYSLGGYREAVERDWVWRGNQQESDNLDDLSVDSGIKMNREDIY
jgi:hypothetical protein